MSEKCKSTSPTKNQVKYQQKIICTEEKLDMISQTEKGEQIVNICCNVRLCHSSVCTIQDNADRITKSVNSGTKVFV
jgi:hypothetical protein